MPTIEFEVWCARCGNGLCGQCHETKGGITVEPCANCLDKEYDLGLEKGREETQTGN